MTTTTRQEFSITTKAFRTEEQSRDGRELAMRLLYQWELQRIDPVEDLDGLASEENISGAARGFATELLNIAMEFRADIDKRLEKASREWALKRMLPVDRNIMRVGVAEMLASNAPDKVIINEAIEVAKKYGGENSPAFVNGLLDGVLTQLREELSGK